jgi:aminopeptidase N
MSDQAGSSPDDVHDGARPLRHQPHGVIGLIIVVSLFLVVAYYLSHRTPDSDSDDDSRGSPNSPGATQEPSAVRGPIALDDPRLAVAISEPIEDSVYPAAGDPGVDVLHYDLSLTWAPETATLTGQAALTLRATSDAESFQLDLASALEVSTVELNSTPVRFTHAGKNLIVTTPVKKDERYRAQIEYAGEPEPVPAPTDRTDIADLGWHVTDAGETWTMQEPFGAYSWYPVNDQPSDKALYDFTLSVPSPMVGVANGELTSRNDQADRTVTTWHLDEPAAAYLVTAAFGDFELTEAVSASGVPISWWTPRNDPSALREVRKLAPALTWAEKRLGPYPFTTLGIVAVASDSAMETQTMITLGNSSYIRSEPVILHELIHQWYGNQVTPRDWRDVWMNEGMTTYLQGVYEAERAGQSIDAKMRDWAELEPGLRRRSGPPGAYDRDEFGQGNIYYGPALMWHELRRTMGEQKFWTMVRAWPAAHDQGQLSGSADRTEYYAWIEKTTGAELSAFFDAWILGKTTPK